MADRSATLILFGATGDLAARMLFPSLYNLQQDGLLPEDFLIVGSGRSEQSDEAFRKDVTDALARHIDAGRFDADACHRLTARMIYCRAEAGNADHFRELAGRVKGREDRDIAIYLSTPPSLFAPTAQNLAGAGLVNGRTRIAMEKPIGHDLASSIAVNDAICALFEEDRIFRVGCPNAT